MKSTLFAAPPGWPLPSSSGKTSPESSTPKTTPSDAFWLDLPEKMKRWSLQGADGQTLVLLMDPRAQSRGESSTPNISQWPNYAAVCSLLQVLEQTSIPQRFFLSSTACAGILRRAEKRGKKLPEPLLHALKAVVGGQDPNLAAGGYMLPVAPTVETGAPFSRTGNERVEAEAMVVAAADPAYCLETTCNDYSRADGFNMLAQPISIHPHCIGRAPEAGPQGKEYLLDGSAYCMDSRGQPQAIAIQDVRPVEKAQNGKGWKDDGTAYTVDTHATQGVAVAQPMALGTDCYNGAITGEVAATIGTPGSSVNASGPTVMQVVAFEPDSIARNAGTLRAGRIPEHQMVMQPYIGGVDCENNGHTMEQPTGPLLTGSPTGGGRPLPAIATAMMVRRLTPTECERLQGFPDNYTNIPWRKQPESPDGPRYKALGNSWAVPVVRWIGERIDRAVA